MRSDICGVERRPKVVLPIVKRGFLVVSDLIYYGISGGGYGRSAARIG